MTDPLELPLRDIHLPGAIPLWPLAPGWWVLIAVIIGSIVAAWFLYQRQQYRKLSAIRLARQELDKIVSSYTINNDPLELCRQVSILFRRVSISLFPRTEVASLTGDKWLEFLDNQTSGQPFRNGDGRIIADAPYRNSLSAAEVELMLKHCRDWIDAVSVSKGAGA